MGYLILLATVPAALIGFFFEDFFATQVRSPWVVVFNVVFVGVRAFGVGLAQAAALVPVVSRSGATITCGLFLGLRREEAAPALVPDERARDGRCRLPEPSGSCGEGTDGHEAAMFLAGSVSSAVVGYVAMRFLLRFLANHTLRIFAYYRFVLAAAVLLTSGS